MSGEIAAAVASPLMRRTSPSFRALLRLAQGMPYRRLPMTERSLHGWRVLTHGFPWFEGAGRFPLPAYSEFMPPPRLGLTPYGGLDTTLFADSDPYGWRVQEVDEVHQLQIGRAHV